MDSDLRMKLEEESSDTVTYSVVRMNNVKLGTIKWLRRWKVYRFYPEPGIVFDRESLEDVQRMVDSLDRERFIGAGT